MKKIFIILLCMLPFSLSAAEYYVVKGNQVRVRNQPNTETSNIIVELYKGKRVIKEAETGEWTKIIFSDDRDPSKKITGWMVTRFLLPVMVSEPETAADTTAPPTKEKAKPTLVNKGAALSCDVTADSGFIQGCDLHLKYQVINSEADKANSINCSAELIAITEDGERLPVPVNQTLKQKMLTPTDILSMHIIMQADSSYKLLKVELESHNCKLAN